MNNSYDKPVLDYGSNRIDTVKKAEEILEIHEVRRKRNKRQKRLEYLSIILLVILIGFGVLSLIKNYGPTFSLSAQRFYQELFAPKAEQATVIPSDYVCEDLQISLTDTNNDGFTEVAFPNLKRLGQCFNITEKDRVFWQETFSDKDYVDAFADSQIKKLGGEKDFFVEAIKSSITTWVLDLREGSNVPTETPETISTPTSEPTPWPTIENPGIPRKIGEVVAIMKSLGINTVLGTTQNHLDNLWELKYTEGDYIYLDATGMPESCLTAQNSIAVSLTPSEGAMDIEGGWVICQ